jgi:3',5'-cyclic-AMP phosphodiesterase
VTRIAIVSDIHHGRDVGEIAGQQALSILGDTLAEIANKHVDLLIDLGDRINDECPATDRRLTAEVGAIFSTLEIPSAHIVGNHDMVHLDHDQVGSALGRPVCSTTLEQTEWSLVVWSPKPCYDGDGCPSVTGADLRWLDANVGTRHPSIVFTHFPLDRQDHRRNYYFHNNRHLQSFSNLDEIDEILQSKDRLCAVISGHAHWNSLATRDDVHYLGVPGMTSTFTTGSKPCRGWMLLQIEADLRADIYGLRPRSYRLPLRQAGARWGKPRSPAPRQSRADTSRNHEAPSSMAAT